MDFTDPSETDIHGLARQMLRVSALAEQLGLATPTGTEADLRTIQAILDSGTVEPDDTYDLQSLGAALGRVLIASTDGLDWAIVHDEYGSDPTLRYRNTPVCLNALTTISKRVEDGEQVDVLDLFQGLQRALRDAIHEVGGTA